MSEDKTAAASSGVSAREAARKYLEANPVDWWKVRDREARFDPEGDETWIVGNAAFIQGWLSSSAAPAAVVPAETKWHDALELVLWWAESPAGACDTERLKAAASAVRAAIPRIDADKLQRDAYAEGRKDEREYLIAQDALADCPACGGVGERPVLCGWGPDAHEDILNCPDCKGSGFARHAAAQMVSGADELQALRVERYVEALRRALQECDEPLAYQHAIIDAFRRNIALAGGVDAPQGRSDAGANHNERERHLGLDARLRAAGMAGLLAEIRNSNYARDMDDDLKDRIDIALSDQGRAVTAATVSAIDASYEAIDGVEGQKR